MGMGMTMSPQIWQQFVDLVFQDNLIKHKHLWDKGQMWPLFATTTAYAMNTFALEALSGFSPF